MRKNKKLSEKIKQLQKEKKELTDSKIKLEEELQKEKEKNKQGLIAQNKESTNLKKERERLKKKNKELTEKISLLNLQISSLEHQEYNKSPPEKLKKVNNNLQSSSSVQKESIIKNQHDASQPKQEGSSYVAMDVYKKIEEKKEEEKKEEEKKEEKPKPKKVIYKGGEKLLYEFAEFCNSKKINIKIHLRKYDTSNKGTISDDKFMNAIIELKTSFTENDIKELIQYCKPKDGGDIIINDFIEQLKAKGYNYKTKDNLIIDKDNKQASKKYDYFENKPYNLDYQ